MDSVLAISADQTNYSQLLDILLYVNDEYSRLPSRYRFDISPPTPEVSAVPPLEPDQPTSDDGKPNITKIDFSKGYPDKLPRSLKALSTLPHTTLESCALEHLFPDDIDSEEPTGYYTPFHEATHLAQLDASLGLSTVDNPPPPSTGRITDKDKERQKQHELHNPVSAYNWLRKNQPQVFLQDHEDGTAAPAARLAKDKNGAAKASPKPRASPKAPAARGTKRARESTVKKEEQDIVLDDDGTIIGGTGLEDLAPLMSGKGKRKRDRGDDDNAYRPKGGSSRAPKKKKQRTSGADKERGSGTPGE